MQLGMHFVLPLELYAATVHLLHTQALNILYFQQLNHSIIVTKSKQQCSIN